MKEIRENTQPIGSESPEKDPVKDMTRTRLRGLEIGGIQIGIEVPENHPWEWPEAPVSDFSCLPREPDVHVGVRVADFSSQDLGGDHYGVGAWLFEVARDGDNWLLGLSRRGVREQLATFDSEFKFGEILIRQEQAEQRIFPLRTPLDEWIVLHRTVARGGLCLTGHAASEGYGAAIELGASSQNDSETRPASTSHNRWFTPRSALFGRQTVLIRQDRGSLRSFRTPWNEKSDPRLGYSARIEKFAVTEKSDHPYRECLDPSEAAERLVAHSIAPLCDDVFFDRVLSNAQKIADETPLFLMGDSQRPDAAPASSWTLNGDAYRVAST